MEKPNFVVPIRGTSKLVVSSSLPSENNLYRLDFLNKTESEPINIGYDGVITSLDSISATTAVITTTTSAGKIFVADAATIVMLFSLQSSKVPNLDYASYIDWNREKNLVIGTGGNGIALFDYEENQALVEVNLPGIASKIQMTKPINGTSFVAMIYVPDPEPSSFRAQNVMRLINIEAALETGDISHPNFGQIRTVVDVSPQYFPTDLNGLSILSVASSEWTGSLRWVQSDGKYVDLVSESNFYCRIGCGLNGCSTKLSPVGCSAVGEGCAANFLLVNDVCQFSGTQSTGYLHVDDLTTVDWQYRSNFEILDFTDNLSFYLGLWLFFILLIIAIRHFKSRKFRKHANGKADVERARIASILAQNEIDMEKLNTKDFAKRQRLPSKEEYDSDLSETDSEGETIQDHGEKSFSTPKGDDAGELGSQRGKRKRNLKLSSRSKNSSLKGNGKLRDFTKKRSENSKFKSTKIMDSKKDKLGRTGIVSNKHIRK